MEKKSRKVFFPVASHDWRWVPFQETCISRTHEAKCWPALPNARPSETIRTCKNETHHVTASGRRFACIINIRQSFIKLGKESLPWQLMHEYEFRIFFLGIRRAAERDFPKHGKVARAPARQSRSHASRCLAVDEQVSLLALTRCAASTWRCTPSSAASSSRGRPTLQRINLQAFLRINLVAIWWIYWFWQIGSSCLAPRWLLIVVVYDNNFE
jgi:hypothetical protein